MASAHVVRTQLQLVFQDGVKEDGSYQLATRSFNNVKGSATSDQLYAVSQALVPLQQRPLHAIERNDASVIMES
ncbi:uncharacterized protein DUF1659 [Melghiribacillus thermohalophilus]|uniref:Uncharacterized protein DUF1659 n=1 Tax=Melghiribacillus thermohalophilus TaxID=1324956 RepID=A0A4R3MW15_9BACI|nr:DUF1659 domain-containing protein [Melghiribacillus thermohalophilus]TCT18074.1 uncharacterized protein DUF1659 [Melghiribacillus thermohalophilus]